MTLEEAMKASFGASPNKIRASFKKTVLIRQYETEVIELESTVEVEEPITGAERIFLSAMLKCQLEYTAYCDMLGKKLVTQTEFNDRKRQLEDELTALKMKAESVTGKSMDKYIELN